MAAAVGKLTDLTLGNYLKIVSKGAVYNNLSEDSPIWDLIQKKKKGPAEGRELRYLIRSAYGPSAAGFIDINGGSYPLADQATIAEGTANYKDFGLTIEVERTLIAKAISDFSKYGEPLAEELRVKSIAMSRQLSRSAYGDGTGRLGELSGAGTIASGLATHTLSTVSGAIGFVGWFEVGDHVHVVDPDGTVQTPTGGSGTYAYWKVESVDRDAGTFNATARTTADVDIVITATVASDGDFVIRAQTAADTTIALDSIGTKDYGTLGKDFVGLESLSANDSRVVNGITLNASLGGTRRDVSGNPIDSQDFQKLLSQVKIRVGANRYKYNKAMMAWETMDALIESREVDRRFQSITDNKRGVTSLGYQHGRDGVMFEADEFCPKQRIYCLPEGDVVQFHGSDFEMVKPEGSGSGFFLKPSSAGGHDRLIRSYMEGDGALISVHNGGIGVIENFVVS